MSNEPTAITDSTEKQLSESTEPSNTYSRWMTNIAADIAHKKLSQLAIPGAHNSGVDISGANLFGKQWGANQDKSFSQQLAAGARFLDLRLVDSSYKKTTGRNNPKTTFYEVFEFKHSTFSAGRRLEHLTRDVKNFVNANPGEIVILDFHHYDKGRNHSYNSLIRCLPFFTSIKSLLIPNAASNLTIDQIRKTYPGRSIILAFDHGSPERWDSAWVQRDQLWPLTFHAWSNDYSEDSITSLVKNSMLSPPSNNLWALSACVFNAGGPKHLHRNHPIRTETFKEGFQNVNIAMVDFIERADTVASVTDRCIELNRQRARDITPPSPPTSFVVKQLYPDGLEKDNYQNTVLFQWVRATDNLGVRNYQIFENDKLFAIQSNNTHTAKDLHRKNVTFKVCAMDSAENVSDFSNSMDLIQDTVPPTIPTDFHFAKIGYPTVVLAWTASYDWAGVEGYEVRRNGIDLGFTKEIFYTIEGLSLTEEHIFEIRAKDINGFYSEWIKLIRPPLPTKLANTKQDFLPLDMDPSLAKAIVTWDSISNPHLSLPPLHISIVAPGFFWQFPYEYETAATYTQYIKAGEKIKIRAKILSADTSEVSEEINFEIDADLTPPKPVTNFKLAQRTTTATTVTWTHSTTSDIVNYAISLNEEAPTLISASANSYTYEQLPTNQTILIEIWAVDIRGNVSVFESVALPWDLVPPSKPGIPQPSNLTDASVTLTWAPSTDNGGEIKYLIYLNGYLVARTEQPQFNLKYLQSHTDYSVEVRAINDAGRSEPAGTTFKTRLRPPTHLRFSHSNGLCRLAWDPVFRQHPAHEVSINGQVFTTAPGRWGYNFKLADVSPGPVPHHFKFSVHAKLDGDTSEVALLEKTVADDVPPSAPGAPVVSAITDSGATLTWEPSSDNIGVTGYRVLLNGLLFSTPDTHFTFTKLTSGAYHRVYVGARDKDGNVSAYSRSVVFKTTGQAPQPAPASPSAQLIPRTSTSVRLEWSKGEGGATQGVRVLVNDEHRFDSLITGIDLNLELDVEHTISVSAFDVYGQLSEPTVLTYVPKDVTPPSLPGNLHIAEATTDSVTLAWESSTDDIGVHEYVIYNNHEYFDSTPLTHYTAVNLLPGTYSFEVCALDLSGNASEPAAITVRTQGPPPSAPSNFRFTQPGLVPTLEWDAPIDMEDVLRYDIVLTGPQGTELPYQSVNTFLKPILLPRTRYEVSITAVSALDRSLPLISELTTK